MNRSQYTTYSTHPAPDATKRTCPAPKPGKSPETHAQRRDRLYHQAAANGCRVHNYGGGLFTVPSQRTGADGRPLAVYTAHQLVDGGFSCDCEYGLRRGPYTADNLLGCCGHTAKVELYLRRKAYRAAAQARRRAVWQAAVARALAPFTPPMCPRCGASDALVFTYVCWHCGWTPARQAVQA